MKTQLKKLDKLKRVLSIDISSDTFNKDKDNVYKDLAKNLKVPGFRPGAAPLDVVERRYHDVLREEFLKRMLPTYYTKALQEHNIEPAGAPRIYDVVCADNKLSFCAEFDVRPEIELKEEDYKGLVIKHKPAVVETVEVEKMITHLKEGIKKTINKDYTDQELAKWVGYASVEALRDAVRAELLVDKLRARRNDIENNLLEELLKKVKVDVPSAAVQEQHDRLLQQELYNLRARGVEEKDIKKYEGDIREKLKTVAERQVKIYYILEAIAKKESLTIEPRRLYDGVIGYLMSCASYAA